MPSFSWRPLRCKPIRERSGTFSGFLKGPRRCATRERIVWGISSGCVVASTNGERGACYTDLPEVRGALGGHYAAVARQRVRELRENLAAVEKGPLSEAELTFMRELGRAVHG